MNFFWADFRAALGDIAIADAQFFSQQGGSRNAVERMHFEAGGADKEARSAERIVFLVIAKDVANVLAKKTLDAFTKFLHAIDIALIHFPFDSRFWLESWDSFVDFVIPRNVRDEVLYYWKSLKRRYGDGLARRERIHASFASEARTAIHFGGARTALGGFAIPANGQVG